MFTIGLFICVISIVLAQFVKSDKLYAFCGGGFLVSWILMGLSILIHLCTVLP